LSNPKPSKAGLILYDLLINKRDVKKESLYKGRFFCDFKWENAACCRMF